jgi:uncharacterized protein
MPPEAAQVQLHGLLGTALQASQRRRLFHFIDGPASPAIRLFDREVAALNTAGDWYGEHAGKWLWAASRAAARSHDDALAARVRAVADHLVAQQREDGYLGTYADSHHFTVVQLPKPVSWDGAPSVRTWDIWVHSYLILGLLEAHRHDPEPRWLAAACRIGDLCAATLQQGAVRITDLGNHHGLSATVLLDPAMELHAATGDARYLELASRVLQQADEEPRLALLKQAAAGADASEIATGKAYQLAWNLVGLAKLQRATGRADLLQALEQLWRNIRDHHLSLGGGPFGGIASRSRETFNPAGVFSPQAYVETCSTLAWLQLNRELLAITGHARHAQEIERTAYNDLLAACAPNGDDWCYYTFANGQRVHTTAWRCCKSSGAMALQELPEIACQRSAPDEISVHLHGPFSARFDLDEAGTVHVECRTGYPFDGHIAFDVRPTSTARFVLRLRIPEWAVNARLSVEGQSVPAPPGSYAVIDRRWSPGDRVDLELPMAVTAHRRAKHNEQVSIAPDGAEVRQQVLHDEYLAITRGPLVYASGLVDGWKPSECVRAPGGDVAGWSELLPGAAGEEGPSVRLHFAGRSPITMVPAYRAGGRAHGDWRVTWLQLAPRPGAAE